MIGSRKWISQAQNTLTDDNNVRGASDNINALYFKKLLTQGKKISQIISYIWFNEDRETAQQLDGYFKRGDDEELKKLLFAKDSQTEEYKLLLKVFQQEEYLPIFDEDDQKFIKFRVATNTFEGSISDPGPSDDGILSITIPYPPCPAISDDIDDSGSTVSFPGFAAIKKSELKEWLNENPNEDPYFYENNPYIPATSS
ncbi:MAG: hypothetical protein VKK42_29550 [Lyngbya sp.]|nr:hypothetical protein [Lyngbya sp.]